VNFDLSEDERMLQDLAERFVADRYDLDRRRAYQAEPCGFSRENWALLADYGLVAAALRPEDGGLGLNASALVTLFTALGKGLVVEPLIDSVVLGARLVLGGGESVASAWRDRLAAGESRVVLAHAERASRGNPDWVETRADRLEDGYVLSGEKHCVPAGVGVDAYIVSAVLAGQDSPDLFVVPADAPGLSVTPWRLIDGGAAVILRLDRVAVAAANRLAGGRDLLDATLPLVELCRAAEAVGVMQRIFDETLDYLRTRSQFNTVLGRFQAIQHRMVAHYAALEQSKALINFALVLEGEAGFVRAVAGARAFISEASIALGHDMIQFHGGMGVTDELAIGHGHKRLVFLSRWPEDPLAKLDRYADAA
jgi:alkylation response protein AidB-like acyl-CoA dehydrogenase